MRFYLGTHEPSWLTHPDVDVPLFITRSRLARRATLPHATVPWALDSGGFTELTRHGRWTVTPGRYIAEVRRYAADVGRLQWAAPQDWMCEPWVIAGGTHQGLSFAGTGLTVSDHLHRTVDNYLELTGRAPDLPFIPVIQGWTLDDYLDSVRMYTDAGVDLAAAPTVGLGSVCRRQSTDEIDEIVRVLHSCGISNLHGFGVKTAGLGRYGHLLASADSMAWSLAARYDPPLAGHDRPGPGRRRGHRTCANCHIYALRWRDRALARLPAPAR